jgi:hypothetical protein
LLVLLTRLIGDRDDFVLKHYILSNRMLVLLTRLIGDRDTFVNPFGTAAAMIPAR